MGLCEWCRCLCDIGFTQAMLFCIPLRNIEDVFEGRHIRSTSFNNLVCTQAFFGQGPPKLFRVFPLLPLLLPPLLAAGWCCCGDDKGGHSSDTWDSNAMNQLV